MTPFDQFWAVCPRKKAKLDAEKAFNQALKLASLEALIEGMKAYAEEQRDTEPRWIAYPASWLRAGQWMDETERLQIDTTKYRQPTPEEARIYRQENPFLDRDPEWIPIDWKPKLRIVGWPMS